MKTKRAPATAKPRYAAVVRERVSVDSIMNAATDSSFEDEILAEEEQEAATSYETYQYLGRMTTQNRPLQFRYKSARLNSDKKWRTMHHFDYNGTYFWDLDTVPNYKYRIDRVVEFRD